MLPASWETYMQVKKQQLELEMEQRVGSKLGKECVKAVYPSPCLFNLYAEYIMQNTGLDESQTGIQISGRNINNLRHANDTTLMAESEEELKNLWMKVKEESEKASLKSNIQKMKIRAYGPITLWQIDGETVETVTDFIGDCSHEMKRCLVFGRKSVTNLDSVLKSRGITLLTKVHIVKVTVFPVVMYGC